MASMTNDECRMPNAENTEWAMPKMTNGASLIRAFSPFLICAFSAFGIQHPALTPTAAATSSLSLYLLSHRIGEERSETTTSAEGSVLRSHFEYVDRGTTVARESTLAFAKDFTPLSFESHGKSYRYFSVDASVPRASGAPASFTLEGVAPVKARCPLVRYGLAQGKPASIALQPSGDRVVVRETLNS